MADVTDATFEQDVIERSKTVPVVVDLWAEWCGPCKTLGPIIEKVIADTGGKVELAKVDVDANQQVARAFQVQSIPAVYALKDGKVIDGFVGAQPEAVVQKFVESLLPTEEETEVQQLLRAGDAESLLPTVKTDDEARQKVIDLLEVLGPDDPRTAAWRKRLTSALF